MRRVQVWGTTVLAVAALPAGVQARGPDCRATLVFDAGGRLSGSPPVVLESGPVPSPAPNAPPPPRACVQMSAAIDPEAAPAARSKLWRRFAAAQEILSDREGYPGAWAVWRALGLEGKVGWYEAVVARQMCLLKAAEGGCPSPQQACAPVPSDPLKDLLDGFGTFVPQYEGEVRNVRPGGLGTPQTGILPLSFEISTYPDLLRVEYDLRRRNPFARGIAAWMKAASPPPTLNQTLLQASLELRRHGTALSVKPAWSALARCMELTGLRPNGDKLDAPDCPDHHGALLAQVTKALTDATAEMRGTKAEIEPVLARLASAVGAEWLLRWAWYTDGIPRFRPLRGRQAESIQAQLVQARDRLLELEAQVEAQSRISVETPTAAEAEDAARRLGAIRKARDIAKARVAALEADSAETALEHDALLYQGLLVASGTGTDELGGRAGIRYPAASLNLMQHHDGSRDFVIMGRGSAAEIRETDRMFVLAENVPPEVQLRLAQTITPIAVDLTREAQEALLGMSGRKAVTALAAASRAAHSDPGRAAGARAWDAFVAAREEFLVTYAEAVALIQYVSVELSPGGTDWEPKRDRTPALVTRLVPQEQPGAGPATVEYALRRKDGSTETEVWKGSYRFNHLYRLRMQAGFLYSSLRTSDFPKKEDGTFGIEQRGPHGVDLTFGTMVYLKRRDIRNATTDERIWPPSLYAGFSVREPLENLFLGFGFEILPSATLVVGPHIGRDERLTTAPDGIQVVESEWRYKKWFVSVVFDPALFARVFGVE